MEVRARALGKIILSREHAVVHGSTYTPTLLSASPPLPAEGLEFSWPTNRIKQEFPESSAEPQSPVPPSCSVESVKSIASLVE
ncbi:hypothetical protein HN51_012819 [Arachis hypogaea]|nr:Mevalonate kinase [Arachis hypogaea]